MSEFDKDAVSSEYKSHSGELNSMLNDLVQIVTDSKSLLEGNAFYHHRTFHIYPELYSKQVNLFWCGKQAVSRICEIGVNAGHSAILLLLGRDKTPLDFTIFDIGHHPYTKPSVNYIRSKFSHVRFEYVEGDSAETIPKWIDENKSLVGSYDVVHIDGGHTDECIVNDIRNADILVRVNGILIIDDTNASNINYYLDLFLSFGTYKELNVLKTYGYQHRIIQKIK